MSIETVEKFDFSDRSDSPKLRLLSFFGMGVFRVERPDGVALRASFLVDRDGIVQHQVVNNLPLGRDVDEMLRMVDALQFTETHGEVCPAGWRPGQSGMQATNEGVAEFLKENAEAL